MINKKMAIFNNIKKHGFPKFNNILTILQLKRRNYYLKLLALKMKFRNNSCMKQLKWWLRDKFVKTREEEPFLLI
jgi:hypothetical protein